RPFCSDSRGPGAHVPENRVLLVAILADLSAGLRESLRAGRRSRGREADRGGSRLSPAPLWTVPAAWTGGDEACDAPRCRSVVGLPRPHLPTPPWKTPCGARLPDLGATSTGVFHTAHSGNRNYG